jgi:polar amino acid transport system permease protein
VAAPAWTPRSRPSRHTLAHLLLAAAILGGIGYGIWGGAAAMGYNWQWERVQRYLVRFTSDGIVWGTLVRGLFQTLQISAVALVLTFVIGLATAILRMSDSWSGRWLARGYMELIRNTPLLVQINIFYFVIAPIFGIDRFWTGVLCLAFFEGAFASEIFRSGILAVSRGQWEAAGSLGLSRLDAYRFIILPQAVRIMSPPLLGVAIALIKDSSIVSVIALFELTTAGRDAISQSFMSFEIWFTVAAMYLVITVALSAIVTLMERRVLRRL